MLVVIAPVDWPAILALAAASVVGGYVGSDLGRHLPESVLRVLIVVAGIAAHLWS